MGYGQLFAPLYKVSTVYSPVKIAKEPAYYQAITLKAEEKEAIDIEEGKEEDDDRDSIKKYSEEYTTSASPYWITYFTQHIEKRLSFHKLFLHSSFSISPYLIFCVFRL